MKMNNIALKGRLVGLGYTHLRESEELGVIGLYRYIFTMAIVVGVDETGYSYRYCYDSLMGAIQALQDWDDNNFVGEPKHWIVRKGKDGDKQGVWKK